LVQSFRNKADAPELVSHDANCVAYRDEGCKGMTMPVDTPSSPFGDLPPMPVPPSAPEVPIKEPEPDLLPDELPNPNPDETRDPPIVEPGVGF
jgi:hypothetical protein